MDIKKDTKNDAAEFINGYGHDTPESREEFKAILSTFAATSAHYALEWAAKHIIYSADASNEERTKEFASNMAMTIRAVAGQAIHDESGRTETIKSERIGRNTYLRFCGVCGKSLGI